MFLDLWTCFFVVLKEATSNKCIASSNKCLTTSNKKLVETRIRIKFGPLDVFFFVFPFAIDLLFSHFRFNLSFFDSWTCQKRRRLRKSSEVGSRHQMELRQVFGGALTKLQSLAKSWIEIRTFKDASSNRCIASRNKCLTSSSKKLIRNNKLLVASLLLVVRPGAPSDALCS